MYTVIVFRVVRTCSDFLDNKVSSTTAPVCVAETQPLLTSAKQKCRDRALDEAEKNSFYCFLPGKGTHSRLKPWEHATPLEWVLRNFLVFSEQGGISSWDHSWIGWTSQSRFHIINLLVSNPVQGLWSCGQQFSSGWGLLPGKKQLRILQSGLICIPFRDLGVGNSVKWQRYSLNCFQFL